MRFTLQQDGRLTDGCQDAATLPEHVEVDGVDVHRPGERLVVDPQNPRRAVADPAARAAKARARAVAQVVSLKTQHASAVALGAGFEAEAARLALAVDAAKASLAALAAEAVPAAAERTEP